MSNTTHTPGPWIAKVSWIVAPGDNPVGLVQQNELAGMTRDEMLSNARLMAAAPAMLEALRVAYADIQRCPGHTIDMLGRIEAAITAATQGQPS